MSGVTRRVSVSKSETLIISVFLLHEFFRVPSICFFLSLSPSLNSLTQWFDITFQITLSHIKPFKIKLLSHIRKCVCVLIGFHTCQ